MKYIKLLLIVVILGGLIYGILQIINPSPNVIIINPQASKILNELKTNVDNDWDNASSWSKDTYETTISDIKTHKKELDTESVGNYETLMRYANEKVRDKLVEFVNDEFKKTNCSSQKIKELKDAIDYFIKDNENVTAKDSKIATVYGKIGLYNQILAFGRKTFALSPGFNISNGSWNDIIAYRESQLKLRQNFKSNSYYSSISHINDVKNSLNSLENKLSKAQSNFEINLSKEIISAYKNVPRTESYFSKLHSVYLKFYGQNYNDYGKLSELRQRFKKEMDDSEIKEGYSRVKNL